jgi:S1-C subfamily serine protease
MFVAGFLGGACAQWALTLLVWPRPAAPPADRQPWPGTLHTLPAAWPAGEPGAGEWTAEERTNIAVYDRANRGVVNITTQAIQLADFWRTPVPSEGSGSGAVLDHQGHILTNYHVIEGVQRIEVTLFDGRSYSASVVGSDPQNDIAVLRIAAPADSLHPLQLAENAPLRVGQKVYALGNPFGLDRTMTEGIISSLNRSLPSNGQVVRTMRAIIQIDAALNRGNSGGPLLNTRGQLIGMNTAIASSTGENTGVGFAIPYTTIARVVPQLIRDGHVTRADLGIAYAVSGDDGLTVAVVRPGGPADTAGIQGFRFSRERRQRGPFIYERRYLDREAADRIVAADGKPVASFDDLLAEVDRKSPGDRMVLTIIRGERRLDIAIQLGREE